MSRNLNTVALPVPLLFMLAGLTATVATTPPYQPVYKVRSGYPLVT